MTKKTSKGLYETIKEYNEEEVPVNLNQDVGRGMDILRQTLSQTQSIPRPFHAGINFFKGYKALVGEDKFYKFLQSDIEIWTNSEGADYITEFMEEYESLNNI